ncbi:hypothetical protein NDU88_006461 [Pleurodeles waltl]|uniref:Uncharacterized protein n=1 Tax=Pleurodeles waltl TaxID=8319 RepID=A0AAV7UMJ8_PLEWA|nr:hypothetical protein NDU88_006461 [Pleurodeles waltl]
MCTPIKTTHDDNVFFMEVDARGACERGDQKRDAAGPGEERKPRKDAADSVREEEQAGRTLSGGNAENRPNPKKCQEHKH